MSATIREDPWYILVFNTKNKKPNGALIIQAINSETAIKKSKLFGFYTEGSTMVMHISNIIDNLPMEFRRKKLTMEVITRLIPTLEDYNNAYLHNLYPWNAIRSSVQQNNAHQN